MNDRIESILLLLRSRHDFDYAPETWSGQLVRRGAIAGEGPSTRIDCPDCQGKGRRKVRGFDCPCDRCKGAGRLSVDAYTLRQVGTYDAPLSSVRMVMCDACGGHVFDSRRDWRRCLRCEGSGKVPVSSSLLNGNGNGKREERTGDPRLDAGIVRSQAGSYDELTLAMGKLNAWNVYAYRAVVALEQGGTYDEGREFANATPLWRGMVFVNLLMPEPIRVPASVRFNESERARQLVSVKDRRANGGRAADRRAIAARNEQIRRLRYVEELSVHEIRKRFPELSRSLVYAILEEEAAA